MHLLNLSLMSHVVRPNFRRATQQQENAKDDTKDDAKEDAKDNDVNGDAGTCQVRFLFHLHQTTT